MAIDWDKGVRCGLARRGSIRLTPNRGRAVVISDGFGEVAFTPSEAMELRAWLDGAVEEILRRDAFAPPVRAGGPSGSPSPVADP